MPDLIGTVLWPIKWAIELVLVAFHWVFSAIGMNSGSGLVWVLSIVGLVIVVRALMIPLFVKQIKSQRASLELAPKIKAIQKKYKGRTDQASRQAMSQEQMALYKSAGTNPLGGCLPVLVQMPVFFGLFSVLNSAQHGTSGVGLLTANLAHEFAHATLFGAKMSMSFSTAMGMADKDWSVIVLAAVLVVLMVGSQFFTQLQILGKNISEETKASPMFKQQRLLMYFLPFIMVFSGVAFPLGVLFYWFVNNLWTMVQQFIVIRNMPNKGTPAYAARQERLASKGKLTDMEQEEYDKQTKQPTGQRQQPVGKARAKKRGGNSSGHQPPEDQKKGKA